MEELLNDGFPFAEDALKGQTALVCGASKGIGRACALMLARAGARVIACARSQSNLDSLVAEMHGDGHETVVLDLEDIEAVRRAVSSMGVVQIVVNNSGGPPGGALLDNALEDFEGPFRRHLHAAHTIVQMLSPGMKEAGSGRIVNIISTSVREPIDNIGLSNTLRGAMASWSKSLSRELAPCITINNILPGFTDTDRLGSLASSISEKTGSPVEEITEGWLSGVPIQRLVDPLETAVAVTFLCLSSSGAISGVSLAVDGGRMRSI
ncbi:MAG: SDR family oxidoreductase [Candidatus Thalassarchaeum sp.]|nr:SDR family oxidoreductase [Candidatus Thalassarchaeum sp.]MDP6921081.1 SDR family oxidoreductase [Candidatus Thalassarchaeum sp.]MEE2606988.1 SDR family NAD(P)-dependent oxidoreductase [Candidatus Thermoplasmatota archaeon]